MNEELLACVEDGGIDQRRVSDVVEGIEGVEDKLSQEHLPVGEEGFLEELSNGEKRGVGEGHILKSNRVGDRATTVRVSINSNSP
jgi:hypothetical protein